MIRVVGGIERVRTHPIGTRWSGVEIVVTEDLRGLYLAFDAHPDFRMIKAPLEADFSDVGANIHQAFYGRAPGGTHLMFTMAVTEARDYDFPTADARVGHIFDVPLVSDNFDRSLGFYRDQLGMVPLLEDVLTEGIWHDAWDLPIGTQVDLAIIKGDAPDFGLGGIELQGYESSFIDPIAPQANRFDGGACLTTYTAKDLAATFEAVADSTEATVLSEPRPYAAAPYDGKRAFSFLGPGGERVEICEELWQS
jgi:catechol 2,3-dioxygenase-like lactoylglutathione lyase family enzyme